MDKIPLQTLQIYKPKVEKPKPEVVIEGLAIELEKVRKNYGTSVQSKRMARFYDVEEEELSIKEKEQEDERMKSFCIETRTLLDLEIKHYRKAYEEVLREYEMKDEYDKKDQEALKKSDERIEKKISRMNRLENIKGTLDNEIKTLIKRHEKSDKNFDMKLKTAIEKYREVIRYLEHELDFQRRSHEETIELFRNLEKSLRDNVYRCENSEARATVLQEELNKAKAELHEYKNKQFEESRSIARSTSRIKCIEKELMKAEERADSAERSLCRMSIRQRTPMHH
ncbi:unnamed protein product [Chironomus riparius]|uniref:Uncharacterized protein n=1 Tax=Chironomus riparius TaxID=315576 RepID=A0A9N9RSB2_9DIPT|nr:unnamed protein product [Chironomus riparius]